MRIMTYKEATLEALAEEMRRDPSVYVMAEDLHGRGGGLSHYRGLQDLPVSWRPPSWPAPWARPWRGCVR